MQRCFPVRYSDKRIFTLHHFEPPCTFIIFKALCKERGYYSYWGTSIFSQVVILYILDISCEGRKKVEEVRWGICRKLFLVAVGAHIRQSLFFSSCFPLSAMFRLLLQQLPCVFGFLGVHDEAKLSLIALYSRFFPDLFPLLLSSFWTVKLFQLCSGWCRTCAKVKLSSHRSSFAAEFPTKFQRDAVKCLRMIDALYVARFLK